MNHLFSRTEQRAPRRPHLSTAACVGLTGLGLYLLLLAGASLGAILLFALILICPLAVVIAWRSQPSIEVRKHTGGDDREASGQ